jgi:hypothetical protein
MFVAMGCHANPARGQESFFDRWPFKAKEKETFVRTPSMYDHKAAGAAPDAGASSTATPSAPAAYPSTGTPPVGQPATSPQASRTMQPQHSLSANVDAAERPTAFASPFAAFRWPSLHMPELSLPKPKLPSWPGRAEAEQARNTWVEKSPDPSRPSPWQAVTSGANRVSQSTKAAWQKTVDVLTPGEPASQPPRVAQRATEPSLWRRMFPGNDPRPAGPGTVNEWMGQERIKF